MAWYKPRSWKRPRFSRRTRTKTRSVSSKQIAKDVKKALRSSENYKSRKTKKTMFNLLLIGGLGAIAYFFRDKLKTLLQIGQ